MLPGSGIYTVQLGCVQNVSAGMLVTVLRQLLRCPRAMSGGDRCILGRPSSAIGHGFGWFLWVNRS